MNPDYFTNNGPLFADDKLADLPSLELWSDDDAAEVAKTAVLDALEKHGELLHEDATEPQTKFFIVNPTVHALGYVYSISEEVPIADAAKVSVDYTLFPVADRFTEVEPVRGTTSFFRNATALCQATQWGESLDLSEETEMAAQQPSALMDVFLRSSGVGFGIVTNGKHWRLLHRGSSDTFAVYFEVDLEKLVNDGSLDDFKVFLLLFGSPATMPTDEGICLLDSLLA